MSKNMSKHTPGPWLNDGSRIYRQQNPGGHKTFIAETLSDPLVEARIANARLIAAAPELLDALRDLLECRDKPGLAASKHSAAAHYARALLARLDS